MTSYILHLLRPRTPNVLWNLFSSNLPTRQLTFWTTLLWVFAGLSINFLGFIILTILCICAYASVVSMAANFKGLLRSDPQLAVQVLVPALDSKYVIQVYDRFYIFSQIAITIPFVVGAIVCDASLRFQVSGEFGRATLTLLFSSVICFSFVYYWSAITLHWSATLGRFAFMLAFCFLAIDGIKTGASSAVLSPWVLLVGCIAMLAYGSFLRYFTKQEYFKRG